MTLVLDAGAFIAVERADRDVIALVKAGRLSGYVPKTHGGIVGEIWRNGSGRQSQVARLLSGVDVVPIDSQLGRTCGVLLGQSKSTDIVDAAVIAICHDGDVVLTSDPQDLIALALVAGTNLEIIAV